MIGVRQFHRCIDEGAPALASAELEFGKETQAGKQLVLWLALMSPFDLGPGRFELPAIFAQALGSELVLGREVTIERRLVGLGSLGDGVDADRMNPMPVEQLAGCFQDPRAWRSGWLFPDLWRRAERC